MLLQILGLGNCFTADLALLHISHQKYSMDLDISQRWIGGLLVLPSTNVSTTRYAVSIIDLIQS